MKVHIFPASGKQARLNYHLTIQNKVSKDKLKSYMPNHQQELLREEGNPVWGATNYHDKKFDKMMYGDYALFYRNFKFFSAGKIMYKKNDLSLGQKLWPSSDIEYQNIIILESVTYIDISTDKVSKILNDYSATFLSKKVYQSPIKYMGYTIYDDAKSEFLVEELNLKKLLGFEEEIINLGSEEFSIIEGKRKLELHYTIERNSNIIKRKKTEELKNKGFLACEICNFNFEKKYGTKGSGYIECHHKTALSKIKYGKPTKLSDLSLLCANCHRMIHRTNGCTIDELTKIYKKYK